MTTLFAIILTLSILGLALWFLDYVFTSPHSVFDRQQYNEDQVCKMQDCMQTQYLQSLEINSDASQASSSDASHQDQ